MAHDLEAEAEARSRSGPPPVVRPGTPGSIPDASAAGDADSVCAEGDATPAVTLEWPGPTGERRRLLERERAARMRADRASGHIAALQSVTTALVGVVTVEDVIHAVVSHGVEVLQARAGTVGMLSDDGEHVELWEWQGLRDDIRERWGRFPVSLATPMSDVIRSGEPLFVSSWDEMLRLYPMFAAEPERVPRSAWAALPLTYDGGTRGALVFHFTDQHQFSSDDRQFLSTLAAQCSQAVDRAILIDQERRLRREAEEAKGREQFLADATKIMNASLDSEATLQALMRLAIGRIADWCVVHLLRPDGTLEIAMVQHQDPALRDEVLAAAGRYPPVIDAPTGAPAVVRTGVPELYPEISPETITEAARDEDHLKLLEKVGLRSTMVVPLRAGPTMLGALTLVSSSEDRRYDEADVALAEDLASRASLAIRNARLYEDKLQVAQTLQRSLLPPSLPVVPGIEVGAAYRAGGEGHEVGGDFYDVFRLGGDEWAVVVGDVCGKDADAAALTALARYTIRATAMQTRSPSAVLRMLNDAILRHGNAGRFCTVIYGVIDASRGGPVRLRLSCGGHPPALVARAGGKITTLGRSGTLMGVIKDPELRESQTVLAPGDKVVFYTDGCIEARRRHEMFGEVRLRGAVAAAAGMSASETAAHIESTVAEFCEEGLADDVALVVLEVASRKRGKGAQTVAKQRGRPSRA